MVIEGGSKVKNLVGFMRSLVLGVSKNNFFTCSKIYENVPFFDHLHSKFKKIPVLPSKFLSPKMKYGISEDPELYTVFRIDK